MKTKTKILLFISGAILMVNQGFAQTLNDYIEVSREVLKTEKKAVVAEAMQLSDTESGVFWELYNEYNTELYKIHTGRVNTIMDFAKNYETMTNEKADELWLNSMNFQSELLKLNKTYYKKFKKIIPAAKAARYFQIENKIAAMINAELAAEIPLVETK